MNDMTEVPLVNGSPSNRITRSAAAETAMTREAHEVQAAMLVAQRCQRDEIDAERRILQACKRKGLAEQAMYAYPKGGTKVTGPSIRLAEVLAQNWGNMACGVKELAQRPGEGNRSGESDVMAYAWDMETNFRAELVFTVKHERHTKQGITKLTDPRDIYELVANQGSRRKRACILAVIPGDIVDAAQAECEKTLAGNNSEPLADRIKKMLAKFEELGVSKAQIEKRLGNKVDAMLSVELVQFIKIYRSIADGAVKKEEFFPSEGGAAPKQSDAAANVEKDLMGGEKTPEKPAAKKAEKETDEQTPISDELAQELDELAQDIGNTTSKMRVAGLRTKAERLRPQIGEARFVQLIDGIAAKERELGK